MKLLVLTGEPITADQLRLALGRGIDPAQAEVMVVAPALQESPLKFWVSDADEAIAKAQAVSRETVQQLGSEGVAASGDSGESDSMQAIADALQTFPAERIVVFSRRGEAERYRERPDPEELRERFGVPVDEAALPD